MGVQEIAALEEQLRQAMVDNDLAVLDRLIDDALLFTVPTGEVLGKADELDARRSGTMHMPSLTPSDQRIAVHGGGAVVTVRVDMAGASGDGPFSGAFRYTRFWRETPDGWRIVGGSVTQLPELRSSAG